MVRPPEGGTTPKPALEYWVIAPAGEAESGGPFGLSGILPKGSRVVSVQAGSTLSKGLNAAMADDNSTHPISGWEVVYGPFDSEGQAENASPASGWTVLGGAIGGATSLLVSGNASGVGKGEKTGDSLTGLNAIGNFFSKLGEANTWLRVGQVLLGIVLLGVGIARITGAQNTVSSIVKARIP